MKYDQAWLDLKEWLDKKFAEDHDWNTPYDDGEFNGFAKVRRKMFRLEDKYE